MTRRFVVAYDVASDRSRRRIAGTLEGHGLRVQRSVFVVEASQHELVSLLHRLGQEALQETDRINAYPVHQRSALTPHWQRRQRAAALPNYWVV